MLGAHHLPQSAPLAGFFELVKALRTPEADNQTVIFHARRNDEMIQALILKQLVHCRLKILFTSTAQRYHSGFTRWLMSQMDSVISTCSAAASYLPAQPDTLIPHGVDAARYPPRSMIEGREASEQLSHRKHIGIFGRVRAQKGIDTLIEAALPLLKAHPDWDLVIVGEITPDQRQFVAELKAQAAGSEVLEQVVFTGKQPFDALPSLFRAMTIVTALSRNEGFGLTVLEAMNALSCHAIGPMVQRHRGYRKVWAAAVIGLGEARSPLSSAFRTTWPSFPSATCVKRAPWRLDSYDVLGSRRRHALINSSLPQPSPPSTTTRADPGAAVAGGGGCVDGASSGALVESQPQGLRESPCPSSPVSVGRTQAVRPSSQPRSAGAGAPPLSVTACWNMLR